MTAFARAFLSVAIVAALVTARADAQSCVTNQVPLQPASFAGGVDVQRFDPALGSLLRVQVQVDNVVEFAFGIENLDAQPALAQASCETTISLARPNGPMIVASHPAISFSNVLAPFDGSLDYAGASGLTNVQLSTVPGVAATLTGASDLELFTRSNQAPAMITLPFSALGFSVMPNAAGLSSYATVRIGASVTVCYEYLPSGSAFCAGDGSGTACPCGNSGIPGRGCANSFDANGARLQGAGDIRVSTDALRLLATGLPPGATGVFYQGTTQLQSGAGVVFGDGLRCIGGSIVRLCQRNAPSGEMQFGAATGSDERVSVGGGVPPTGGSFEYQLWYRNAASFCTSAEFNLTNGLHVTWQP